MKKINLLFLLMSCVICMNAQTGWVTKQSLPFGIAGAASFTIGSYGYIVSGITATGYSNATLQYDAANDMWTQKADAGSVFRLGAVGFSVIGKGYIGMGFATGTNALNDLLEYNPSTNTWTSKANIA